jgi:ABC-type transporter Mla subunit MlaD
VGVMDEIDSLRERLETAAPSADGVADTLEAASKAFDLLLTTCRACEDRSAELFAAFSFASAAAAQGRHLLSGAPSLPLASVGRSRHVVSVVDDLEGIADALAGLAQVMSGRLSSAARDAPDPGDRGACAGAAREAGQIYQLLKRDR